MSDLQSCLRYTSIHDQTGFEADFLNPELLAYEVAQQSGLAHPAVAYEQDGFALADAPVDLGDALDNLAPEQGHIEGRLFDHGIEIITLPVRRNI